MNKFEGGFHPPQETTIEIEKSPNESQLISGENLVFEKIAQAVRELPRKASESSRRFAKLALLGFMLSSSTVLAKEAQSGEVEDDVKIIKSTPNSIANSNPLIDEIKLTLSTVGAEFGSNTPVQMIKEVNLENENVYDKVSAEQALKVVKLYWDGIDRSDNSKGYFENLERKKNLLISEKLLYLQILGFRLGETYNHEMLNKLEIVKVSDDAMLQSLKDGSSSSVCGGIHTFMAKAAQKLGFEAWVQSTNTSAPHVQMGLITENKGKKEIVFFNYDNYISTGTTNYRDALGIVERNNENIALLSSIVASPDETLFRVKSKSQLILEDIANIKGARISEHFTEDGNIEAHNNKFEIKLSPDLKALKLSSEHLGLSYFNYKNPGDNFNSLGSANALRGDLKVGSNNVNVEANVTALHLNIMNLKNGSTPRQELVSRLALNYINNNKLTSGEFGKLVVEFGATLEAAMVYIFDRSRSEAGEALQGNYGARLVYVNPSQTNKLWAEYEGTHEAMLTRLDNWSINPSTTLDYLKLTPTIQHVAVGGEVQVYEGTIVNAKAAVEKLDFGKKLQVSAGVKGNEVNAQVDAAFVGSDYTRFAPSSASVKGAVQIRNTPIGEFEIYGALKNEKYKDTQSSTTVNFGLQYRIILH